MLSSWFFEACIGRRREGTYNTRMLWGIRPGKVTCAGLVAILMVLPTTLWKKASARTQTTPVSKPEPAEGPKPTHRKKPHS